MKVRVDLPSGGQPQASIWVPNDQSNAGPSAAFLMHAPAGLVARRFRPGEARAYFRAETKDGGVLELGERLEGESW